MAELYRRYGLYEEAAGSYHALIARDPNSDSARQAQAELSELETLHRPQRDERISQLRRLAGFLHQQRDRRGANEALERILLQDPEDATAWRDLAYLSATGDSLGESLELTRRSLEVAPGNHPALLIRAHVLGRQRKFRQALVIYRSILETEPGPRVAEYAASMERSLRIFADVR
jgi:tetratricopeptide (TPR) repeat protein